MEFTDFKIAVISVGISIFSVVGSMFKVLTAGEFAIIASILLLIYSIRN